jgi:hypothetical protein
MSRRHAWLRFTAGGPPLEHRLEGVSGPGAGGGRGGVADWQEGLRALQGRWYAVDAPPQVAAAFVLQWVLQVPAHTAAHAAAAGPWRAGLRGLTFSLGPALVPELVRLTSLTADDGDLTARLDRAEHDYRAVAGPLAAAYDAIVRIGPHARDAFVDDMWVAARREAESVSGLVRPGVAFRASCCLIYALPGCVECAGCPRLREAPSHH